MPKLVSRPPERMEKSAEEIRMIMQSILSGIMTGSPYSDYKNAMNTAMKTLSMLGIVEDYVVMEGRNYLEVAFQMPGTSNFVMMSAYI